MLPRIMLMQLVRLIRQINWLRNAGCANSQQREIQLWVKPIEAFVMQKIVRGE